MNVVRAALLKLEKWDEAIREGHAALEAHQQDQSVHQVCLDQCTR